MSQARSQTFEPKWFPIYVEEILDLLGGAGLPPAEVQTRLRAGEDLRDLVRLVNLQDRIFIGLGLLTETTKAILRGEYAVQ